MECVILYFLYLFKITVFPHIRPLGIFFSGPSIQRSQYIRPRSQYINVWVLSECRYYLREGLIWGNTVNGKISQTLCRDCFLWKSSCHLEGTGHFIEVRVSLCFIIMWINSIKHAVKMANPQVGGQILPITLQLAHPAFQAFWCPCSS